MTLDCDGSRAKLTRQGLIQETRYKLVANSSKPEAKVAKRGDERTKKQESIHE
jgi:hypothetical protein